jgi:hypothetical protein
MPSHRVPTVDAMSSKQSPGPGQGNRAGFSQSIAGHKRLERHFVVSSAAEFTGMSAAPVTPARSNDNFACVPPTAASDTGWEGPAAS